MRVLTISRPVLYQQRNPVPDDQSVQYFENLFLYHLADTVFTLKPSNGGSVNTPVTLPQTNPTYP